MTSREIAIAAPLVVMAVVLGIFPETLLKYTDATIKGFVDHLNPARQSAQFSPPGAAPGENAKPQARVSVESRDAARDQLAKPQTAAINSPLAPGEGHDVHVPGKVVPVRSPNSPVAKASP